MSSEVRVYPLHDGRQGRLGQPPPGSILAIGLANLTIAGVQGENPHKEKGRLPAAPLCFPPCAAGSYGRCERPMLAWGAGVAGNGGGVGWVLDCPALALAIELTKAPWLSKPEGVGERAA